MRNGNIACHKVGTVGRGPGRVPRQGPRDQGYSIHGPIRDRGFTTVVIRRISVAPGNNIPACDLQYTITAGSSSSSKGDAAHKDIRIGSGLSECYRLASGFCGTGHGCRNRLSCAAISVAVRVRHLDIQGGIRLKDQYFCTR